MDNKDNYKEINLRGSNPQDEGGAFYADLKNLDFIPEKKVCEIEPTVKKGKWFFWKLLGFIPLIPLKAHEDLYRYEGLVAKVYTEDIIEYFSNTYNTSDKKLNGNVVYEKARVIGTCHEHCHNRYRCFDTNKEAMEYFEYTKKRCKDYDNHLG